MIAAVEAENLGPIAKVSAAPDPRGITTFAGPSQVGKTTLTRAMLAPWLGDALPVRTGEEQARLVLTTGGGTTIQLGYDTAGSWRRLIARKGAETPARCSSQTALAAAFCPAATHPDVVRAIAVPGEWERLYRSELARPLRDLLMRVLPPADIRGRLVAMADEAGVEVRDEDLAVSIVAKGRAYPVAPDHEDWPGELVKRLKAAQATANTAKSSKAGERDRAAKTLVDAKAVVVVGPTEAEVVKARADVEAGAAWATYDAELVAWRAREVQRAGRDQERAEWETRKAALGERPTLDAAEHQAARVKVANAQAALDKLRRDEAATMARVEAEAKAARDAEAQAARARVAVVEAEARGRASVAAPVATVPGALFVSSPAPKLCQACNLPVPR